MGTDGIFGISDICTICYDSIYPQPFWGKEKESTLNCGHVFHKECIGEWLQRQPNCLVCKKVVSESKITIGKTRASDLQIASFLDLHSVRNTIHERRRVRRLNPDQKAPVSKIAKRVNFLEEK